MATSRTEDGRKEWQQREDSTPSQFNDHVRPLGIFAEVSGWYLFPSVSCSRSEEESTAEESTKWSAFPLLLACWTAPFLATSNCSSATKSSSDQNRTLFLMGTYTTSLPQSDNFSLKHACIILR